MGIFGYEVGCFGDLRLQKGGPCCTVRWLSGAVVGYEDLRATELTRFSSIDFCGTLK